MHVDRTLFLALTATLAGAACATAPPAPPVSDVPLVAAPVAPPDPAPIAASPPPPRPTPVAPTAEGGLGDDDDDDFPSAEGGMHPAGEGGFVAPAAGCGHSSTRFDASRAACNESTGTASSCQGMPKPVGCGDFPFPREHCESYRTHFKPQVAERAVKCAIRLSGKQVCDACLTYRCGHEAIMGSCPDPTADADCATITRSCSKTSMAECRSYLSGMNTAGRKAMVRCMSSKGGCGFGLYSCLEGI